MSPKSRYGSRGCGSPSSLTIVRVGRFQLRARAGQIVGTFAMYYKEPRDATQYNIDVAAR
jgi:hypothetical protein